MTKTAEKKKMVQVLALWRKKSVKGSVYFSGKFADGYTGPEGEQNLTAFYNTDKKNLKEPDIRIYTRDEDGDLSKEPFLSLWCNASKNGNKYLSGKLDGKKVVGFINIEADEKHPYIKVYWSEEDTAAEKKAKAPEAKPKGKKKEPQYTEGSSEDDNDLPF